MRLSQSFLKKAGSYTSLSKMILKLGFLGLFSNSCWLTNVRVCSNNCGMVSIMPSLRRSFKSPMNTDMGDPDSSLNQNSVVPVKHSFCLATYFLGRVSLLPL